MDYILSVLVPCKRPVLLLSILELIIDVGRVQALFVLLWVLLLPFCVVRLRECFAACRADLPFSVFFLFAPFSAAVV